ncbi:unnamed protein product [Scytosiphon promiscuus]
MKQCSNTSCQKYASFNAEGNKTARYCKQHAETGMVNVRGRRCSQDSCMTQPAFNTEGSKQARYASNMLRPVW